MITEFLRKLAYCFRRRRFEEELDEEMRHHLSMAGRAQFGNVTRWKEECREIWTWALLEQLLQDLRYAVRAMNLLARSPGLARRSHDCAPSRIADQCAVRALRGGSTFGKNAVRSPRAGRYAQT